MELQTAEVQCEGKAQQWRSQVLIKKCRRALEQCCRRPTTLSWRRRLSRRAAGTWSPPAAWACEALRKVWIRSLGPPG